MFWQRSPPLENVSIIDLCLRCNALSTFVSCGVRKQNFLKVVFPILFERRLDSRQMLVQLSFSINFLRWLKTVVWTMIKNFLEWQGNIFIKLILIWLTIIVIQSIIFLPIFCGVAQLYFLFKLTSSFTFTGNCNPQKILFKIWLNNIGENFLEWYRNKDITKFTNIIKSYSDQFSSALLLSLSQSYILFNGWHPWLHGCKYHPRGM